MNGSWATSTEDLVLVGEAQGFNIDPLLLESKDATVAFVAARKRMLSQRSDIKSASYWKEKLALTSHVEGGAFKEMYRSAVTLPSAGISHLGHRGDRAVCTGIYFLLEYGEFSAFHRIVSDEMWHFYDGYALCVYEIKPSGELITHLLGKDVDAGEKLQVVISGYSWFASRVERRQSEPHQNELFALCGCTVSPGFDFEDFELAARDTLVDEYPQHKQLIEELTR
jgi:predicted cupin superfamily sugar epimerase